MFGGPARPAPGSAEQALQDAAVTGEPIVIVWRRGEHYMDGLEFGPGTVIGYCHDCDDIHRIERAKIKKAHPVTRPTTSGAASRRGRGRGSPGCAA